MLQNYRMVQITAECFGRFNNCEKAKNFNAFLRFCEREMEICEGKSPTHNN